MVTRNVAERRTRNVDLEIGQLRVRPTEHDRRRVRGALVTREQSHGPRVDVAGLSGWSATCFSSFAMWRVLSELPLATTARPIASAMVAMPRPMAR